MIKIFRFIKDFLKTKKTDVILISFPKAGSTWLRSVYFDYTKLYYNHNFKFDEVCPEINNKYNNINCPFPRLIKTHRTLPLFITKYKTIYLWRNHVDVLLSYSRFLLNKNHTHFQSRKTFKKLFKTVCWKYNLYTKVINLTSPISYHYDECLVSLKTVSRLISLINNRQVDTELLIQALNKNTFNNIKKKTYLTESFKPTNKNYEFFSQSRIDMLSKKAAKKYLEMRFQNYG